MKTDRLYIRTLRETDWVEMKNVFIDFNNSKYAIYDMPLPVEDNEAKVLTKRFADSNLFFAIYYKNLLCSNAVFAATILLPVEIFLCGDLISY